MEDSLLRSRSEVETSVESYPRISSLFWVSLFTGLTGMVTLAAAHGTHDFYHFEINGTAESNHTTLYDFDNSTCTHVLVSLWAKCVRSCNESVYACSGLSPNNDEAFITITRVLESFALLIAIFAWALSITSHIYKRMGELKTSVLSFLVSGILNIVGAYLFILNWRDHIPGEDREVKPEFLDQGPGSSFYLCVASFVMVTLSGLLNGTEWCRAINYGLD